MNKEYLCINDKLEYETKGSTPKYVENSSVIVLNQKCIRNGIVDYSFSQFISEQQNIAAEKYVKVGDVLLNSTGQGTAGRCAFVDYIPENYKVTVDSHMLILRFENIELARFFAYSLFNQESFILELLTGSSGQGELDREIVYNISFPYNGKNLEIFNKILIAINNKIKLNNKINKELEKLAKTLYEYWFVQFDFPDENNRPYKSSGGKMVYSDILKREIPLGWDIELINTRYNFLEGPGITKDKYVLEKGHKFLNIKCINDELGDFEIANASMIDYKYIEQYNHFLMKEKDICISTSGTLGRFGVIRKEHLPILLNTSIIRFRNIVNKISYEYMYAYLRSDLFVAKLNTSASGSIQKNVGPTHLNEYFEVFPPKKIDDEFSNKLKPIINKTLELKSETQKLKELRDFLLPMLMNGQISIRNN